MSLNDYSPAQDRCKEAKLVWLEPSSYEDSEYVKIIIEHVYKRNGNTKCPATPFCAVRGLIRGGGDCGTHMAIGSENSNTFTKMMDSWQPPPPVAHIRLTFLEVSYF